MIQSTQKVIFWIFSKFYCPHPTDYIEWVNDEWESYWFCTICGRNNLWERLKIKLYPYKRLLNYKVWKIKKQLGILKREGSLPF